jgi:hypothetical protein
LQFGELRFVAGVGLAAGPQPVAQGEAHVVLLEDFTDIFEALIEHVLPVVLDHPFGQDGTAAADDAGDPPGGQRNVLHQHTGVNRHIIHALLGLLFDHFEHDLPAEIFHAAHARKRFVDGHRADGHRRRADDGFADGGDVAAGGKVHHRVGAVFHGVLQFLQFAVDVRQHGGIPDIGIDFAIGGDPNAHRFQVGVMDVGRNDHPAAGYFGAY